MPEELSGDFKLDEFRAASDRALTPEEEANAARFATELLQPIRNLFGPVCVTSFVRTGDHIEQTPGVTGEAVDFVPCSRDRGTMARMHLFAGLFLEDRFGQLILEEDHIHATLPGVMGKQGETLVEVGKDDSGELELRRGMIFSAALIPLALLFVGVRWLTQS